MHRYILSLLLFFLSITISFAQKDLRSGYIISNNFDTIYGLIDYRGDIYNCSRCFFYKNSDSRPELYYPGSIYAYRFKDSRFYVSKAVKIESEVKTVFLEYLVNGITQLYYFRDNTGDHYYIEKGTELYELTNKVSEINLEKGQYLRESNFYKGILTIAYSDAENIIGSINASGFDRKSMIKLSEEYHNMVCKDRSCIIYEKKIKNFKFNTGPVIGYQWAQTRYLYFLASFQFNSEQLLYMGIAANLKFPSINDKLNLRLRGMFGKDNISGAFTKYSYTEVEKNSLQSTRDKILTSADLKYEYPTGKFRPTFAIGTEFSFIISQQTIYTQYIYNTLRDIMSTNTYDNIIHYNSEAGVFGAIGFSLPFKNRSLFFECYYKWCRGSYKYRLEPSSGDGLWITFKSDINAFGISTGFLF
jgi:hypothetical protein